MSFQEQIEDTIELKTLIENSGIDRNLKKNFLKEIEVEIDILKELKEKQKNL